MEHLKYFETMAQSLFNAEINCPGRKWGSIIGLQCSGIPEEIIHAAGMLPMRVRAPGLPKHEKCRRPSASDQLFLYPVGSGTAHDRPIGFSGRACNRQYL